MSEDRIVTLIETHLGRYPESELADVYKLLHQGVNGPGHLIPNKRKAREWLEHESGLVQPDKTQPLIESIHPDGAVVRLHVRPYLVYRESVVPLLDAFVRSAREIAVDNDTLGAWWAVFQANVSPGAEWAGRFNAREVGLFGLRRSEEGWPAMHHSPVYARTYHPTYRVLSRKEAESLCKKIDAPFEMI